jgi:hypothetical protein
VAYVVILPWITGELLENKDCIDWFYWFMWCDRPHPLIEKGVIHIEQK